MCAGGAHQGFSVGGEGRKSADGIGSRRPERSHAGGGSSRNEHDAAAEELAALGEFVGEIPRVPDRRVLIGVLASDPIGRQSVFVHDVKEEAHASRLGLRQPASK